MTKHQAEVALREAAVEFASLGPPKDARDSDGLRANRKLLRAASKIAGMAKKRAYSREFTPKTERRVMLTIDRIPPTLYDEVRAKAKREGVSLRALVLNFLSEWVGRSTR